MKTIYILLILQFVIIAQTEGKPIKDEKYTVYYLSIGNGHYQQDPTKFRTTGFIPYDDLPGAISSAQIVSKLLTVYSGATGITLLSSPSKLITRKDIVENIFTLIDRINKEKKGNPLFVFYYCGHGLAENNFFSQFILPGDFSYMLSPDGVRDIYQRGYITHSDLFDLAIHVTGIVDRFEIEGIPYCVIADCCRKVHKYNDPQYETAKKILEYNATPSALVRDAQVASMLKYENIHFYNKPVIFNGNYGDIANLYPFPQNLTIRIDNIDPHQNIGPLCRRLLLLLNKVRGQLTLSDLISRLTDSTTKDITPVPVSFYKKSTKYKEKIFIKTIGVNH